MRKFFTAITLLPLVAIFPGCGGQPADETPLPRVKQFLAVAPNTAETLTLPSDRSNYTLTQTASNYSIAAKNGEAVVTSELSLKRIHFADISIALDTLTVGSLYRLYQAAFNRTPDVAGLGYWLQQFDTGTKLLDVAAAFVASEEFKKLYGTNPTDLQFLTALYNNVLHREPDLAGQEYWLKLLGSGVSRPSLLISFAESPENQTQTSLAIKNGIPYAMPGQPYRPVGNIRSLPTVTAGDSVALDGTGSTDANNDPIAYEWSLSLPAGSRAAMTAPTSMKPSFVPDVAGLYAITLQVSDGKLKGTSVTASLNVAAKHVTPVADTGIYKCSLISHDLAVSLYSQGHTYLDRDHDGKPCEANDKSIESPTTSTPTTPPSSTGKCWVNGYRRSNGTYVNGYWRKC